MRPPDGAKADLQQNKIRASGNHDKTTGQNDGAAKGERILPTQCRANDAAAETKKQRIQTENVHLPPLLQNNFYK